VLFSEFWDDDTHRIRPGLNAMNNTYSRMQEIKEQESGDEYGYE
jgi:hypothetical protein